MSPSAPRACVVSEFYPRRRDPALGVWAERQTEATREAGAEIEVFALERPVPPAADLAALRHGDPRPLLRSVRAFAGQPREEHRGGDVRFVRFLSPPRERSYASWHRWARPPLELALRGRSFDVVHAHNVVPAGAAVSRFCARRGVPLVVSVHGGDVYLRDPAVPPLVREVLATAGAVLCNSSDTLRRAAAIVGSDERMRVVHLGTDTIKSALPMPSGPPTVATLGHLVPRKRHADVARAVALIRREAERGGPLEGLRWRVIGDGSEREPLRELCGRLDLLDAVDFLGPLDHDAALAALATCQLMAMPSVDEAFGVAYIEALGSGIPAIGCFGEGGPEEIAALGRGMLLVPPGDIEALAGAIEGALSDRRALGELARSARATAEEHFTWERCGRETLAVYEQVRRGTR